MELAKSLQVTINLHKKGISVIRWNEKHASKQAALITYTLEKKFFSSVTFKVLWDVFFQSKKNCSVLKNCGL